MKRSELDVDNYIDDVEEYFREWLFVRFRFDNAVTKEFVDNHEQEFQDFLADQREDLVLVEADRANDIRRDES